MNLNKLEKPWKLEADTWKRKGRGSRGYDRREGQNSVHEKPAWNHECWGFVEHVVVYELLSFRVERLRWSPTSDLGRFSTHYRGGRDWILGTCTDGSISTEQSYKRIFESSNDDDSPPLQWKTLPLTGFFKNIIKVIDFIMKKAYLKFCTATWAYFYAFRATFL